MLVIFIHPSIWVFRETICLIIVRYGRSRSCYESVLKIKRIPSQAAMSESDLGSQMGDRTGYFLNTVEKILAWGESKREGDFRNGTPLFQ